MPVQACCYDCCLQITALTPPVSSVFAYKAEGTTVLRPSEAIFFPNAIIFHLEGKHIVNLI